jgi:hypothetical protein
MPKKTLAALKRSIKNKWEGIVAGTVKDYATDNCDLCKLFFTLGQDRCKGCPVMEATGLPGCENTPYDEWDKVCNEAPYGRTGDTPKRKAAARKELKFLRSLLPKERS